jgi:glucose-6-phosphate isomerase
MRLSFADYSVFTPAQLEREVKKLSRYREEVLQKVSDFDDTTPEFSLVYAAHPEVKDTLEFIKKEFKAVKHVLLVGIGGSSLGVEAVHSVLGEGAVKLTVLDTIAANEIEAAINELSSYKKVSDIAVCVVSKSGNTTETLVNAGIVLDALKAKFGEKLFKQTIFIGNKGTDVEKSGKKIGAHIIAMPEIIGGRYSVGTLVGLVPLALLQHDADAFIEGFLAVHEEDIEEVAAESAARIALYMQNKYAHYNFFAFEKRLATLGKWYRQLFAESIGKSVDRAGKPVTKGFLPTISTPVELHSIGQLYLSGFSGVYTDFVTFDDESVDFKIPKQGLAKQFSKFTAQEVTTAIYGGVVGAYHEKQFAHRTTIFEDELAYELGLFMAMRMRETMYVAELLNLNAFDQPNVELYKVKTKAILGL